MGTFKVIKKGLAGGRKVAFDLIGLRIFQPKDKTNKSGKTYCQVQITRETMDKLGLTFGQKVEMSLDEEDLRIKLDGSDKTRKFGYAIQKGGTQGIIKFSNPRSFPETLEITNIDEADITLLEKENSLIINCKPYIK
jgi:hypothetical protein